MGDDKSVFRDEEPAHRVTVGSFLLGKFEVTQGQWRALMASNPSHSKDCGDNCPVEQVSWEDAQAYLKKLSAKAGYTYRLPTEAEWEYAARAGSQTNWHFGDDEAQLGQYAWYRHNAEKKTYIVGGKQVNPFGLYDMHGNVWEWVEDCYRINYRGAPKNGSARQQSYQKETARVLRGGSWNFDAIDARAASRNRGEPTSRNSNIGFRVARTPR
jgi:formylglycine-generating enzyme required for sulfatase activity